MVTESIPDQPDPLPDQFRNALRGLGSTVTIITTSEDGVPHSMVATATMSVSLEPPVLLIAVNRSSSSHDPIERRQAFCVNVLGSEHAELGQAVARAAKQDRFAAGQWAHVELGPLVGIPYLVDAQATILCRVIETLTRGTHTLFLGEVQQVISNQQCEPLLYCDGNYGEFARLE
jgi:flavin reductase